MLISRRIPQLTALLLTIVVCTVTAEFLPAGEPLKVPTQVQPGDVVELQLFDGRKPGGRVTEVDATHIWLETSAAGISLRSGFPRHNIAAVHVCDEKSGNITPTAGLRPSLPALSPADVTGLPLPSVPALPRTEPAPVRNQRVANLQVSGYITSWDADADVDGVLLAVNCLDVQGRPTAADGLLEVHLSGRQPAGRLGKLRASDRVRLESWTIRVRPGDFAQGFATYRLEFRKSKPEDRLQLTPVGTLQAKVSVTGQGVFQSQPTDLLLRNVPLFLDATR